MVVVKTVVTLCGNSDYFGFEMCNYNVAHVGSWASWQRMENSWASQLRFHGLAHEARLCFMGYPMRVHGLVGNTWRAYMG